MPRIAYIRVSTLEQTLDRQIAGLKKYDIDKWFEEKVSAKDTNRPQLQAMLDFASNGDTIYVHDFSRLARSTKDLLQIVEQLQGKGVHLVSNKENIDTSTSTGKLMLTMIGAISEFERANLLERQAEGIAIARERGVYKGHRKGGKKRKTVDTTIFEQMFQLHTQGKIPLSTAAKALDLCISGASRRFKERREAGDGYDPNVRPTAEKGV